MLCRVITKLSLGRPNAYEDRRQALQVLVHLTLRSNMGLVFI